MTRMFSTMAVAGLLVCSACGDDQPANGPTGPTVPVVASTTPTPGAVPPPTAPGANPVPAPHADPVPTPTPAPADCTNPRVTTSVTLSPDGQSVRFSNFGNCDVPYVFALFRVGNAAQPLVGQTLLQMQEAVLKVGSGYTTLALSGAPACYQTDLFASLHSADVTSGKVNILPGGGALPIASFGPVIQGDCATLSLPPSSPVPPLGANSCPLQPPSLGSAQSFAILGASTVTNTGSSVVTGDLGLSPGTSVTGFPPGLVVGGTIHAADAVALAAQNSTTTAYNSVASQSCTQDLTGQDLGGKTLTPGVYCFSSSAQLTGPLTLNAQGNSNAVFMFKIGSTLTTASGSAVILSNGGSPCNVLWDVGSSATLGTATAFTGNILAAVSVTLNTGASITGRALARTGAVTLDTNSVTVSNGCGCR